MKRIRDVGSVAHQPADFGIMTRVIYRGDGVARRQLDHLGTPAGEKGVGADDKRVGPLAHKSCEGRIAFGPPASVPVRPHAADRRSRDEVLGPPLCRIYERSAVGPLPPNAPGPPSLGVFARRASKMLGWWVRRLSRPTPFFDDRTKAPRAVPRVLTRSERAAL
jgi:hypothetical protein